MAELSMAVQGERIAGRVHRNYRDRRHPLCLRQQSVAIIHDADECHDETIVQLHGGHVVRVPCSLDQVLRWFS
jgi:hypothetical protein